MRPLYCGNFDYDARQYEIERLFTRYGKVDRVDMKSGFAFVYMFDERDAQDAIRALDRTEFGRHGRRLRVEWTKQERGVSRRSAGSRRSATNMRPTKSLFVINFDPTSTRVRDIERHFDPFGEILNVRIRRNFAFVQYELQEDATRALEATNERMISVEYAASDDNDKRNRYSPQRRRDRTPERSRDHGKSPSSYGQDAERASPDYGQGGRPHEASEERGSPDLGRAESPATGRFRSKLLHRVIPVEYAASDDNGKRNRYSPQRGDRTPEKCRDRSHSPSSYGRDDERASPDYGQGGRPHQASEERGSPDLGRAESPANGRFHSPQSLDHGQSLGSYGRDAERANPDYAQGGSPRAASEERGSLGLVSPANERFGSQSSVRSRSRSQD